MTDIDLPDFDIPHGPPARIHPDVYWEWVMRNIVRMHKSGHLDRLAAVRLHPVDARFELQPAD